MDRWPHQIQAKEEVIAAFNRGENLICLSSPTGGGKTLMVADIVADYLERGKNVILYTNRVLLRDQLSRNLKAAGLHHGTRAAGYRQDWSRFQISSIQTEHSRVTKRGTWNLYDANLAVIDECHSLTGKGARKLIDAHWQEGCHVLGVTATPLNLEGIYQSLIQAGTNSELRACGALVPARHFGPDEPDFRALKKLRAGVDISAVEQAKVMMTPTIWGRVFGKWCQYNPDSRPTLLFAPGVGESIWFAEQFSKKGIKAAHIDGESVWVDGKQFSTSRQARADILGMSRDGQISILCNRFVLREGFDAPWISHGVFACVFGSISSYLQAGGRLLRAHPGVREVTIQDHGGNWWRHGSLNADRCWKIGDANELLAAKREDTLRHKREPEPKRCPQCDAILMSMLCRCGCHCSYEKRSRPVVSVDGTMKEMKGDIYRPRETRELPTTPYKWSSMYYRARNTEMTFRQAEALFFQEHHHWPPRTLKLMPMDPDDWFRRVRDVPEDRLI